MMMQSYKKPRKTAFFAPQKRKLFVAGRGAMGASARDGGGTEGIGGHDFWHTSIYIVGPSSMD